MVRCHSVAQVKMRRKQSVVMNKEEQKQIWNHIFLWKQWDWILSVLICHDNGHGSWNINYYVENMQDRYLHTLCELSNRRHINTKEEWIKILPLAKKKSFLRKQLGVGTHQLNLLLSYTKFKHIYSLKMILKDVTILHCLCKKF